LEPDPDNAGGGKIMDKKENGTRFSTRLLAEIVVFVAMATALSFITVYTFPQGGSITAGSMVPILWLALRRGPRLGLFAGAVFGLVELALMPFIYYPVQVLLDYPLAFGALGLAGFFKTRPVVGVVVGITGRFVMHFISGVVFFASFAPAGMSPIAYSAIYNASYLIPEMVISGFIIFLLQKSKALKLYM
jgi:thiamine transporter